MSPAGLHRPQMTPAAQLRINVSLILASFTASIYFVQRHMLYNDLDESIENEAGALWGTIRFEGGRPSLENAVSTENIGEVEHFVRVSDASENVMFDSGAAIALVPVDSQAIKRALAGKSEIRRVKTGDDPMRVGAFPVLQDRQIVGVLEIGQSEDDVLGTLATFLRIMGRACPVTLVVAVLGGIFLATRAPLSIRLPA